MSIVNKYYLCRCSKGECLKTVTKNELKDNPKDSDKKKDIKESYKNVTDSSGSFSLSLNNEPLISDMSLPCNLDNKHSKENITLNFSLDFPTYSTSKLSNIVEEKVEEKREELEDKHEELEEKHEELEEKREELEEKREELEEKREEKLDEREEREEKREEREEKREEREEKREEREEEREEKREEREEQKRHSDEKREVINIDFISEMDSLVLHASQKLLEQITRDEHCKNVEKTEKYLNILKPYMNYVHNESKGILTFTHMENNKSTVDAMNEEIRKFNHRKVHNLIWDIINASLILLL
jgi:DNA repair exonuclease SbcCD ATPase subunit